MWTITVLDTTSSTSTAGLLAWPKEKGKKETLKWGV